MSEATIWRRFVCATEYVGHRSAQLAVAGVSMLH